ncbi:uncharacterized protein C7443_11080 [Plasticicumulans acidivorans]|uniref:Large ribosomal RNA subunit accumulation protein YceD n=2 Tax=Plasticicumulans acidivorans TaxID=886464 RepID=A0A317MRN7_9GAMM|nr:uncharacterized protein C7443_11080 [Plasticicumulans acidivorans]
MHARPADRFDPWKLAASGERVEGSVPLAQLGRLTDLLRETGGDVRYRLRGEVDAEGRKFLSVDISADVVLACQRCFGPLLLPLHCTVALAPVASEAQAAQVPEHYEPVLAGEEGIAISEVIEDELLLALPLVAMHENLRECEANGFALPKTGAEPVAAKEEPQPFAALAALLKKSRDQE